MGGVMDAAHPQQLREQRDRLLRLLEDEARMLPIDGRIILGGLSQGASMAMDLLLHFQSPLAVKIRGVFSRRTLLQSESVDDLPHDCLADRLAEFPVLATHGTADEMVAFQSARKSYRFLSDNGAYVSFRPLIGLSHNGYCKEESVAITDFTYCLLHGP